MQLNIRAGEVPKLIRNTAEEIAGTFYDMNRTDQFRKQAGSQRRFVRMHWKDHVHTAIECLAGVLGLPGTPEAMKEPIYQAIMEFNARSTARTPSLSLRSIQ